MKPLQRATVDLIRSTFNNNCSMFTSIDNERYCYFHVYENQQKYTTDKNIVVLHSLITDVDGDGFPMTTDVQISIDVNGVAIPLNQIYTDDQERIRHLRQLTKIQ